jgi:hypothetical protein
MGLLYYNPFGYGKSFTNINGAVQTIDPEFNVSAMLSIVDLQPSLILSKAMSRGLSLENSCAALLGLMLSLAS